tara:strand:+ start:6101 stop:6313 length:213 start_codon:yes stop_codon:yes gene_type:complete
MSNMSYCRFQNTSIDLDDCVEAIRNQDLTDLSKREMDAFISLVEMAKDLAEDFEDYNEDELYEWINNQQK